ncbi:copper fist DNA binding domain-containing protein [Cadophora sp. MPI-SDFR-AT-0126]|nr:copper fist DNA binding domain-containing protein [Leotiomycetes sp. MPI-SDFR-AT-0126]
MPLINGCKYSCEPCIRGHRATSCAHTDRILIEVRKPGRPLESCGHNLNTCHCGKVAEIFTVNDVMSDPPPSPFGTDSNSNFVVTTPPASSMSHARSSRSKPRTKSQSRVNKRAKKKIDMPPISPPSSSPKALACPDLSQTPAQPQQQARFMNTDTVQDQVLPYAPSTQSSTYNHSMQFTNPNPQPYQAMAPVQRNYMNYPSSQEYTGPGGHQILYEQPQHTVSYSSRIEDVTVGQDSHLQSQQEPSGSEIRSQYILATWDSLWRAMR